MRGGGGGGGDRLGGGKEISHSRGGAQWNSPRGVCGVILCLKKTDSQISHQF